MTDSRESEKELNASIVDDKVAVEDSEMNDDDSRRICKKLENVEVSHAENTTQMDVNDILIPEYPPVEDENDILIPEYPPVEDVNDILIPEYPPVEDVNTNELSEPKLKLPTCKQKHRSRVVKKKSKPMKKRKWRPLWKLTRKERDKVHEREMKRIQRDRDALLAAGVALAPHNTSDFLIRDRNMSSPHDYDIDRAVFCRENCFDKDFEEDYENFYNDYLDKLTKFELIERWIDVEDAIEVVEKQLNAIRERKRLLGLSGIDVDSEMTKIEVFKEEINKLIVENEELLQKNARLEKYLSEIKR